MSKAGQGGTGRSIRDTFRPSAVIEMKQPNLSEHIRTQSHSYTLCDLSIILLSVAE